VNFYPMQARDLRFMPEITRPQMCEDTRGIVAVKDDVPQAICVFDNWSFNSVMIHIWIENAFVLRHGFAEEVFKFAFCEGREIVIGITPSDNEKALRFIRHIGFEEVYRIKNGYKKGVDYVVTEMHKDKCRYI